MTTILRLPGENPSELTLADLLLRNAEDHGRLPALTWYAEDGAATTLTWSQARRRVAEVAAGLAGLGVTAGEHVLLLMGNRPEHWLTDLALVHLGAVPVSVYPTAAPGQIAHIAGHSRARLAVVGGSQERARVEPLVARGGRGAAGGLRRLVVADDGAAGPHTAWSTLPRPYEPAAFEESRRRVRAGDPVTVVYTSGTTGDPKGVVISHRNVVSNGLALDRVTALPDHADHLCYLPFAHIAERMLGIYLPVLRASHVHLCADPARVAELARRLHPAEFFGVPRIWEKLAASVRAALDELPADRRAAVEAAGEVARAHARCRERGGTPPPSLAERYARARREVLEPLLARAGLDRLVWTASASAPMPPGVLDFWAGLGLVVMDAWGLTETTGAFTLNGPDAFRLGSVGRPLEGGEVRTAADGEIEVRGPTVFEGYLRADGSVEPGTDEEGWFATGDIGRIDEDGFLWLTGRKKDMIVTSTGKNVSPALVENALKEHPLIGQAYVHGDGRPYLVALLVLDAQAAPAWAARNGVEAPWDELAGHPAVRAEADRAVAAANARLSRPEQVRRYRLLSREWSPETGELTPSLKVRRRVIQDAYRRVIQGLYEDHV
ncbi:long-chain fatty acid--CoA ligase [Streptomyces albus subsp. chlorinus]|uniref:AMP-dependent synthetase/ligase n=1 Tax=Streptomyces albus TaxID=1888 RepID=UPI00157154E3|nr:AMP-dependent synthetase/ligase [Streptomyces albus]NSC24770.1 long-chain fatty acid--CoA ligase [Streptomyces albus subsp. chlorinus]